MAEAEALQLWGVRKRYGVLRKHEALRGVSIRVEPGECYGLAGPNGAGKTTLIRILLGLSLPDEGEVRVFGQRPDDPEVRRRIGFVPEAAELPPQASPRRLVRRFAMLRGLVLREAEPQGIGQLERLGMSELLERPAGKLSKGEKQRTLLALALMGSPDLLVLDEPTDGLDPMGRALVRRVLREEREKGRTVFLNSHLLSETERVCTRMGILHRGQLVREELVSGRSEAAGASEIVLEGGRVVAVAHEDLRQLNEALDRVRAGGGLIAEVRPVRQDLEASFEAAVTGDALPPPPPGPRPMEPPALPARPLRALRGAARVAREIAAELAGRRVGWIALALLLAFTAIFFLVVRSDMIGGAAAGARRFGAGEETTAKWIGRYAAGVLYWGLLPGSVVFAALFAPPLLEPRRTVLLHAQPVSRGDVAAGIFSAVLLLVLAQHALLVALFFGGLRWLHIEVSPRLLLMTAPLLFAFAALYAVSLAVTYAVRSGLAAAAAGFLVFVLAAMASGGSPRWLAALSPALLPRIGALSQQAMRLGAGERALIAPFVLTGMWAAALFLVALFAARRSEK
ncbi:MAG TPA: ATP-binding cassette domain-containing protein [Myxococcales bacterium]